MRIIKEGKIPNFEYVFTCHYCDCEFAVTRYELFDKNPYIDKGSYKCPTCGTQVFGGAYKEIEEDSINLEPESESNEVDEP